MEYTMDRSRETVAVTMNNHISNKIEEPKYRQLQNEFRNRTDNNDIVIQMASIRRIIGSRLMENGIILIEMVGCRQGSFRIKASSII